MHLLLYQLPHLPFRSYPYALFLEANHGGTGFCFANEWCPLHILVRRLNSLHWNVIFTR